MEWAEIVQLAGRTGGEVMDHKQLQHQVLELAKMTGIKSMHVRTTVGAVRGGRKHLTATSIDGWPDLVLWSESQRFTMGVELKVPPDRLSVAQHETLHSLERAGWVCMVITPADLQALALFLTNKGAWGELHYERRDWLLPAGAERFTEAW